MSNRLKIKKVQELAHRSVHVSKLNRAKGWRRPLRVTPFEFEVLQGMEDGHWEAAVLREMRRQDLTPDDMDAVDVEVKS